MTKRNHVIEPQEGIEVYFPPTKKRSLVQAKVSSEVVEQVRFIMKSRGYTWNEVIEACLRKFAKDMERPL